MAVHTDQREAWVVVGLVCGADGVASVTFVAAKTIAADVACDWILGADSVTTAGLRRARAVTQAVSVP